MSKFIVFVISIFIIGCASSPESRFTSSDVDFMFNDHEEKSFKYPFGEYPKRIRGSYISPSWFADKNSAPTQSHIAIHAYGKAKIVNDSENLLRLMSHQVNTREKNINGNWEINSLGEDGIESRLKRISGLEISINRIEASFRLLQDESDENVNGVLQSGNLDKDTSAKIRDANNGF